MPDGDAAAMADGRGVERAPAADICETPRFGARRGDRLKAMVP